MPALRRPIYFASPAEFRAWLEKHHATHDELLVGFRKRKTGLPTLTWPESVDAALCFGWIDGKRKRVDDLSYTIRFTPRKPRSIWSAVNVKRAKELEAMGRMRPPGAKAFAARADDRTAIYSYEQRKNPSMDPAHEARLRANRKAWAFFEGQAPWYRRAATHWIASAKKEETRLSRLETLIDCSAEGKGIPPMLGRTKKV